MKHVSILTPLGHSSLSNIEGTYQILSEVNKFLAGMGRASLFNTQLVGLSKETRQTNGLFTVNPDLLIQDVTKTDLIIIPAVHGDQKKALALNKEFIPWMIQQYRAGAEIASFCIGAFFPGSHRFIERKTMCYTLDSR